MSAHDFTFTSIDGTPLDLTAFAGKALLVVNTASECGFTPQYAGMQELWRTYRGRGLVVLGVPSDDFGGQEPGDEAAITSFCTGRFGVDFPMTAKQTVVGGGAHPFYRWIAETLGEGAAPRWNFHKYLFDPAGAPVEVFSSRVEPMSPELTQAVEAVLPA